MGWTAWLTLAAGAVAIGQSTPPPLRDLLANPRPLTPAQIEQVLGGARQALLSGVCVDLVVDVDVDVDIDLDADVVAVVHLDEPTV